MTIRRRNPRKQGEIGLGAAIAWFLAEGYAVAIPLCDNQPWDLIVEKEDDGLQKVQVKTTTRRGPYGNFHVQICTRGGNQSFHTTKPWDPEASNLLFILTDEGDIYLIPSATITAKTAISLCGKYEPYRRARWHIRGAPEELVVGEGFEPS